MRVMSRLFIWFFSLTFSFRVSCFSDNFHFCVIRKSAFKLFHPSKLLSTRNSWRCKTKSEKVRIFVKIMNTSTPIKRIRFRGDSFQSESEQLLENEFFDEVHSTKNGEIPRSKGLFIFEFYKNYTQSNSFSISLIY